MNEEVKSIMVRMEAWNTDFIRKVFVETKGKNWREAAKRTLKKRKADVPRLKRYVPPEIKRAARMAHALDAQFDSHVRSVD